MTLHLAPCTSLAARFACRAWHYSGSVPCPPLVRYGVWESGQYVGCVLFARGANRHLAQSFGLSQTEACELSRIALRPHETSVSRIVSVAVRLLRRQCPGLRLIVSFADPAEGHVGAIYQAMNWTYVGQTERSYVFVDGRGRRWHPRMVSPSGVKRVYGRPRRVVRPVDCERVAVPGKHRYALALDDAMRHRLRAMARPYPKRERSADSGTAVPTAGGGAHPTRSLHHEGTHA